MGPELKKLLMFLRGKVDNSKYHKMDENYKLWMRSI